MNAAVRVLARTRKHEHITPTLRELHWHLVDKRLQFKILLITFKALHGQAPVYIIALYAYQEVNTRVSPFIHDSGPEILIVILQPDHG